MSVIKYKEEETAAQKWIPVLLLGVLGIFGSVAFYYFTPAFRGIDLLMSILVVIIAILGYNRRITRGILSLIILYFATGAAGLLYQTVTPFIGSVMEALRLNLDATRAESTAPGHLAFSYAFLTIVIWVILEALSLFTVKESKIAALGILDKIGGLLVHLMLGIVVAAILFNLIGYGRSRPTHDAAYFRRAFNNVVYLHYLSQSFWFGKTPPPIYVYDVNVR